MEINKCEKKKVETPYEPPKHQILNSFCHIITQICENSFSELRKTNENKKSKHKSIIQFYPVYI